MGDTVEISLEQFEETLWGRTSRAPPQPPMRAVDTARREFRKLFFTETGDRKKNELVKSDSIAITTVSKVVNKISLPNDLCASISQSRIQRHDPSSYKVHAGLYSRDVLSNTTRADWAHMRLYLQFEEGSSVYDPFNDASSDPTGKYTADELEELRDQMVERFTKAVYKTLNYQHRTFVCALLLNAGGEFRATLLDRKNLYVSASTDFAEDPTALLRVLWTFASLDDVGQGIDPTAVRVLPGSPQHARMDLWARENAALDMPYEEDEDVTRFFTTHEDDHEASLSMHTRSKTDVPTRPVMEYVRAAFRDSLAAPWWPRYKLRVGPEGREFLVGKPVFMANGMFGPGTRGYVALDAKEDRFVFLKDVWRISCEGVEAEGVFLEEMAAGSADPDVKLEMVIPTVVAHGNVLDQTTRVIRKAVDGQDDESMPDGFSGGDSTSSGSHASGSTTAHDTSGSGSGSGSNLQPSSNESCTSGEPDGEDRNRGPVKRGLVHYRLAMSEVCMPMSSFKNGKQLVRLIVDCMKTHRDAYNHFHLMHRDISWGNVLIIPVVMDIDGRKIVVWKGALTDWELSKRIPKDRSVKYRPNGWVGTFQFTSVAHVNHPDVPKQIADELESFLHVLIYHGMRYLRNNLYSPSEFIVYFYHTCGVLGSCSPEKTHGMRYGRIGVRFKDDSGKEKHPLSRVMYKEMLPLFVARYTVLEWEDHNKTKDSFWKPVYAEPSADTKAKAALLDNHDALLAQLQACLDHPEWPLADKVGDQLGPEMDPDRRVVSLRSVHCDDMTTKRPAHSENSEAAVKRRKRWDEN
ncbi:hypothetical protein BD413DRAFT_615948 [Trametes elegans]|nr:hypothetical protein BD413DRAFT_615948 [Trametes elegans]